MYALIDCNNFYASCERIFKPQLNGKAVIVLSNNDGCVIARSNESKKLGIKMGQPYYQVKEIVESANVAVFSANLTLYGDISNRVMQIIKEICCAVEIYSIDEAFVDLNGLSLEQIRQMGEEIVLEVKRYVGVPVSVGIAPTKTLAKVASKLCKQYPKLNGCCVMYKKEDIGKVLSKFPIGDIWGIGRRYGRTLGDINIKNALDFVNLPENYIKKTMGVTGLRTWEELRGNPCILFEDSPTSKKQICTSRTFAKEINDFEELKSALVNFLSRSAQKMRQQKCSCGEMKIFIATNRFKDSDTSYNKVALVKFNTATDSTLQMVNSLENALRSIFDSGVMYKKAGVILSDIIDSNSVQLNFFDDVNYAKHTNLMNIVDKINSTQGKNIIILASENSKAVGMGRSKLSPCYTTNWNELLKVK